MYNGVVWIVNPFDNLPMEGNRPQRYWLMSRAFAAAGWRVVYWTGDFSHASKNRRVFVRENTDPGIELRMVPVLPYRKNVCLRRVASHRRLARDWTRLAEACADTPDVVVASMPPLGLCRAAMEYSRRHNAFFIADIMDAWPETFERIVPKWSLFALRAAARRIYRGADAVSAVASRYVELAKSYGATAPTMCCYHGIDISDVSSQGMVQRETPTLRLVYIGSFGASYDLETAIKAVKEMPDVTFDLAGSGPKERALRELAADCARIRFHGYLGDAELKSLLADSDVGLVPMFPDSCVGIPYKLADYAVAGLRVAECLGGETSDIVGRFNAGEHYSAGDADSLRTALERLRARGPNEKSRAFAAEFDARTIMPRYVEWASGLWYNSRQWKSSNSKIR